MKILSKHRYVDKNNARIQNKRIANENLEEAQLRRQNNARIQNRIANEKPEQAQIRRQNNARIQNISCLLYTSPSPRDATLSRMPSSA